MKGKKSNQDVEDIKKGKSTLIPSKEQYRKWSMPSRVTYISFVLTIIGLGWAILTFVVPFFAQKDSDPQLTALSAEIGQLRLQNEELLQLVRNIQSECLASNGNISSGQNCEKVIEAKTGLTELQISEAANEVIKESTDYIALGNAYYYLRNFEKALSYYLKAANENNPEAFSSLGEIYLLGNGVDQSFTEAEKWYRKAAELGHPSAQHNLGNICAFGAGAKQDYSKAFYWYKKAALQELAVSESAVGAMYLQGQGVEQNYSQAIYWLEKAAEKGIPRAMGNLGSMYNRGLGVRQDNAKAMKFYEKAIQLGDPVAKYNLGTMFLNGEGVKKDLEKAVELFKDPANEGMAEAQYFLGEIFFKEKKLGRRDYQEARKWYLMASENGFVYAQQRLGLIYEIGIGVVRDTQQAIFWYSKAANQGDQHSKHRLTELAKTQ
ncbi:MAG: SEL1-like repeat protein [Haliscomenobacter sp.]|nr:SEL1-like repeat protein [Haliscomenobacter sp.]MBK8654688.1 SEL1-like repeat protein [Haliscomenobacter sp.]MBP9076596.1 SEL1-like repeat protein [Haliscomenobacter sp.]